MQPGCRKAWKCRKSAARQRTPPAGLSRVRGYDDCSCPRPLQLRAGGPAVIPSTLTSWPTPCGPAPGSARTSAPRHNSGPYWPTTFLDSPGLADTVVAFDGPRLVGLSAFVVQAQALVGVAAPGASGEAPGLRPRLPHRRRTRYSRTAPAGGAPLRAPPSGWGQKLQDRTAGGRVSRSPRAG